MLAKMEDTCQGPRSSTAPSRAMLQVEMRRRTKASTTTETYPFKITMTSSLHGNDAFSNKTQPVSPHVQMNQGSFLVASVGFLIFCVFVVIGDYNVWAYPLLIAASLCVLLYSSASAKPDNLQSLLRFRFKCRSRLLANDANHNLVIICSLFVALPCSLYFTKRVVSHILSVHGSKIHKKLANDFGLLSATAMSYFLIPVSNHSILLKAVGIGEIHALRLHIWAGCIAIFGGLLHGLYYLWIWFFHNGDSIQKILPEQKCLAEKYNSDCHSRFINLLGMICGVCFILLGLTSLWWVRRNYYRIFYFCHAFFSIILLFGLMMHYNKMILFLSPSLVYYAASKIPMCFEGIQKWCQGGVGLARINHIPYSGGCVELSFRMIDTSSAPQKSELGGLCGKYTKLCVPKISIKGHPFTVFSHPNHPDELKVIFRSYGKFTAQLSERLLQVNKSSSTSQPRILANGLHTGSDQWNQALQHDTLVIITGGVGIVSYISLLSSLRSLFIEQGNCDDVEGGNGRTGIMHRRPQRVHVHWICRDNGLIQYVTEQYFAQFQELDAKSGFTFTIYHTGDGLHCDKIQQDDFNAAEESAPYKASVPSMFEGGQSLRQNLHPAVTFMAIAWGGMWIVKTCYEDIQKKHVVETRLVAVFRLIIWSVAVSIVSILSKIVCSFFYCKKGPAAYSQLDSTGIEIECSELPRESSVENSSNQDSDDDGNREPAFSGLAKADKTTMGIISYQQGRPDIASLIQNSLSQKANDETEIDHCDVGIFMCGPRTLSEAVRKAINEYYNGEAQRKPRTCFSSRLTNQKTAVVYEEVYEM